MIERRVEKLEQAAGMVRCPHCGRMVLPGKSPEAIVTDVEERLQRLSIAELEQLLELQERIFGEGSAKRVADLDASYDRLVSRQAGQPETPEKQGDS